MKFERGKNPKDAMNIGEIARIKNEIIAVLPDIISRYIFEIPSAKLAGHFQHEIEIMTGHKTSVDFCGENPDMIIIVNKSELNKILKIKASFPW